jgi:hypothetical protein
MKRSLLLLLLLACDDPKPPPQPKVVAYDLQWKLKPNQTFWVRTASTSEQGSTADGPIPSEMARIKSSFETKSLVEVLVLDEGPAGEFGLRLTPLEFWLKGTLDGVEVEVEYKDGHWTVEKIGEPAPTTKMNVKEKIREMKESSTRNATLRYGTLSTRHKGGGVPLPISWPILAGCPMTPGSTWTEATGFGPAMINLKKEELKCVNTLTSVEGDVAIIDGSMDDLSTAQGATLHVKRERRAEFDVKRGMFIKMSDAGRMLTEGTVPIAAQPGKSAKYKIWYRMTTELNLLDKR